jgi:DsbC/DsbD-like thiol-disulfide interchange protein
MRSATIHLLAAIIGSVGWCLSPSEASADMSAWDGDTRAAMRLVSAGRKAEDPQSQLRAGAEIRLAPGWKTYWRYPGDSGIPPQFDFAKSENVKSVQVSWPAPERIVSADGVIIGYRDNVLFPLRVEAKDPNKPVTLRIALDYAICEKVCIPVHAKAELVIKNDGAAKSEIIAAEKRVPRAVPFGADAPFSVKKFHRDASVKPARVLVDIVAPKGSPVSLFAEGPTADWALPIPEKVDGAPDGTQRFAFALDGLPPGTTGDGATIKLTAIAGDDAIETTFRLD